MKIKLSKTQEEFIQLFGKVINNKYVFFPKIYIKKDNYEYEEVSEHELPEGIQKYIINERNKKE